MTHYTPGQGSCGVASADTDDVVALSLGMMANGVNPNENPKVGCFFGFSFFRFFFSFFLSLGVVMVMLCFVVLCLCFFVLGFSVVWLTDTVG